MVTQTQTTQVVTKPIDEQDENNLHLCSLTAAFAACAASDQFTIGIFLLPAQQPLQWTSAMTAVAAAEFKFILQNIDADLLHD